MKKSGLAWLCSMVWLSAMIAAGAQTDEQGFDLGVFRVLPSAEVLGAYDKAEGGEGDFYGESRVSIDLHNTEARVGLNGSGHYGYRAYDKLSDANDDFYGVAAAIGTELSLLKFKGSAEHKKTVDYDTQLGDRGAAGLGSYLTASTSTRTTAGGDVSYDRKISDKTALMPGYGALYYKQTVDGLPDLEWYEHTASLQLGYAVSSSTLLTLLGSYNMQFADDEDGTVAAVSIGTENRYSEKVRWSALVGVSAADYEKSGTDQGMEGSLNVQWQATDKVATYVFAESAYEPGTLSLGARKVYRAGYGGKWALQERFRLGLQILHDRQEWIRTNQAEARHFATATAEYDIGNNLTVALADRYLAEESEADQNVVSISATAWF